MSFLQLSTKFSTIKVIVFYMFFIDYLVCDASFISIKHFAN